MPYGYFADPASKQLIITELDAARIREIFKQAAKGKSLVEIAEILNERNSISNEFETDRSPWTPRRISAVLSNRHYIGQIKYGDAWVEELHEPIVEERLFMLAREQTAQRRTTSRIDRSVSSIPISLRGLVDCPKCSRKLSIGTDVKKIDRLCKQITPYYRCRSNAGGRRPCTGVRIQARKLENRVIDAISANLKNTVTIERVELAATVLDNLAQYWTLLNSSQRDKLLPFIIAEVIQSECFNQLSIRLKSDALEHVRSMAAYGHSNPPASASTPSRPNRKNENQLSLFRLLSIQSLLCVNG